MEKDCFDVDQHMARSTYEEVLDGMGIAREIIPSMFSPCKNLIYLKTEDSLYKTEDYEQLKTQLKETEKKFKRTLKLVQDSPSFGGIERLELLRIDYILLSSLAHEDSLEDSEYFPDRILENL